MNDTEQLSPQRQSVTNGLAITGFIALIVLGIWLAVYATQFVPSVVGGIGAAAVSLGSVFNPAPNPSLTVASSSLSTSASDASTTISFGTTGSSTAASSTTKTVPPTKKVPVTAGTASSETIPLGSTAPSSAPFGLPDLTTSITAVGYLATTSAESFVASATVPNGSRPAVKFTIKNVGTNVTGAWRFSASIPTQTAFIFQSEPQQSLAPGDSIDYTLGFDQANRGSNQTISVTANFDSVVAESNKNNNSAAASITILGS